MKLVLFIILLVIVLILLIILGTNNSIELISDFSKILKNNFVDFVEDYTIPKTLFQTYHTKSKIPSYINDNISTFAGNYKRTIYDDSEGLAFIREYFNDSIVNKYLSLKGAHRADLLRYCYLYIHGGVYLDIKSTFLVPLDSIINHKESESSKVYSVLSTQKGTIYQGFIASSKNNIFFLQLIHNITRVSSFNILIDYLVITRQFFNIMILLKNNIDFILFQEKCITNTSADNLDRYGYFCRIFDNDNPIMNTRDPSYPW